MSNIASEVVRGEMIGRNIKVVAAKNKTLIGVEGNVVDETKSTFIVDTKKGRKRLLKQQIKIEMMHKGKIVRVEGSALMKRPEDRIKNKVA